MKLRFSLAQKALAAIFLVANTPSALAAYACSVTATSLGVLYTSGANTDDTGTVTLNCTRLTSDANSLTYRLYIDNGANSTGSIATGQRRALRTTSANYLNYGIYRNAARSQHWRAPTTGTTNVVTGTLSFGTATNASVSATYYLRVPSGQSSAPAGHYLDTLQASGRYPNSDAGTLTNLAPISLTIGVGNQCVFRTQPAGITLNYTSFSATAQTATTSFAMRCTNTLPYTLAISPASNTLLGLNYTVALDVSSSTGTGSNQTRTITATIPAGQSGTCATASCTASQVHTVTISY